MSKQAMEEAKRKESVILDEIERIGIRAETEGRNLQRDEVARIEKLSKQFDVCEESLGHDAPGRSPSPR